MVQYMRIKLVLFSLLYSLASVAVASGVQTFENHNVKIHDLNTQTQLEEATHGLNEFKKKSKKAINDLMAKARIEQNDNKVKQLLSDYQLKLNTLLYRVKIGELDINDIDREIMRNKVQSIILLEQNEVEIMGKTIKGFEDILITKDDEIDLLTKQLKAANNALYDNRLQAGSTLSKLSSTYTKKLSECKDGQPTDLPADEDLSTTVTPDNHSFVSDPNVIINNLRVKSSFLTKSSAKVSFELDYTLLIPVMDSVVATVSFPQTINKTSDFTLNYMGKPTQVYLGHGVYIVAVISIDKQLRISYKDITISSVGL